MFVIMKLQTLFEKCPPSHSNICLKIKTQTTADINDNKSVLTKVA